ncbi:hypothetical protein [Desulfoluna sp.]|uniref:hypothetical protein n=1 Tax=Desulfoluna sp. TaxID=2045199 RepID=UPI002633D91A|nr:hypothetical protein [Desulfoluna sp.]
MIISYNHKKKLILFFRYVLAIPKTLIFNFRYFKLPVALKFPVIVSHNTRFIHLGGRIEIGVIKPGIVRIGFGSVDTIDFKSRRTLFMLDGTLRFRGKAKIGYGSALSVTGTLDIGHNFQISSASTIICAEAITIGNDTLLSWDILIMDTDQHTISCQLSEKRVNPNKRITIGDHVWIGARCTILKGSVIPGNTVVASATLFSGNTFDEEHTAIGGTPPAILKTNIQWHE